MLVDEPRVFSLVFLMRLVEFVVREEFFLLIKEKCYKYFFGCFFLSF